MSELVKCATCKTEKPFSEMQTCMHADREYSVCDMTCMIKFYKGEIKPDAVVTPDLEEMGKLGMNPTEYQLHKDNLELTKQLAKANERVALLERVEKIFNESPELTFENVKSMFSEELNKLAIEKKIEAVIFYGEKLKEIGFSGVDSYTDQVKEMLRKEQASE